jgi:hypothetical protein
MGVYYETIPDSLKPWILAQKVLWVGTAPLSADGHINISPKGAQPGTFGIPSSTTFWFMDLTGSGVETTAHLHEPGNGRLCVMFMAFDGAPRILRLWGRGKVLEFGTPEFDAWVEREKVQCRPGTRSVIVLDVEQCGTSCGFSVPLYEWRGWRDTLDEFFRKKVEGKEAGEGREEMDKCVFPCFMLALSGVDANARTDIGRISRSSVLMACRV